MADNEPLNPADPAHQQVVAKLQILSELQHAPAYAEWGRRVDAVLREVGDTDAGVAAALEAAGPEPTRPSLALAAESWLGRQGLQVLYRGQEPLSAGQNFQSSVARGTASFEDSSGLAASQKLAATLEGLGYSPHEMTALYNDIPMMFPGTPPELMGVAVGGAGIPFSKRIPAAAGYAQTPTSSLYGVLTERTNGQGVKGRGFGVWEYEYVILHELERSSVVSEQPGLGLPFIPRAGGAL